MVNAGRILIMSKGTWDNLTAYSQLDLVSLNGIAYLARQASVGVNPSTDTSMTYWQPFGSASSIATTTTPGLVMPDDSTIKVAVDGTISVPIDGVTIKVDSVTGELYAEVASAMSDLSDVNISSASNGQSLVYDSSASKWKNSNISAATVAYSNATSGLVATNAQAAIDEVNGNIDTKVGDLTSLTTTAKTSAVAAINELDGDMDDITGATTIAVDLQNWTADTTSQSGTTLYKKAVSVNHVYVDAPTVDIGAGTGYVLPTTAEQESYDLMQYATVDGTTLYLYASEIPTTAFYIKVTGVD